MYPQFGSINYLSNFNHNTWHSGNITVEKRYGKGLRMNASYNYSKSLSNDDHSGITTAKARRALPMTRGTPSARM